MRQETAQLRQRVSELQTEAEARAEQLSGVQRENELLARDKAKLTEVIRDLSARVISGF